MEKVKNNADIKSGENLRLIRKLLNKTTYEMASELKIPQSTYSKYENGWSSITVEVLSKLYRKYGAMPNFICCSEGPKFRKEDEKKNIVTDISMIKADQESIKAKLNFLARKN